jgi:hypothetical protein
MEKLDPRSRLRAGLRARLDTVLHEVLRENNLHRFVEVLEQQRPDASLAELLQATIEWLQAIRNGIKSRPADYDSTHSRLVSKINALVPENVLWQAGVKSYLEEISLQEPSRVFLEELVKNIGNRPTTETLDGWLASGVNEGKSLAKLVTKLKQNELVLRVKSQAVKFSETPPAPSATLADAELDEQLWTNYKETVDCDLRAFLTPMLKAMPTARGAIMRQNPYRNLAHALLTALARKPEPPKGARRRSKDPAK